MKNTPARVMTEAQIRTRVQTLMAIWLRGVTEGGRYATRDQVSSVLAITERAVREGRT